jgi:uncharacterized delta-60 repeat protein
MHLPRHPVTIAASLLAVGALGTGVAFAATAGDQDPAFNDGAPALLAFPGSSSSSVMQLVVAPDGSIFTGAGSYGGAPLTLAHLGASGTPVAGFGTDGLVSDDTISGLVSPPEALAVAADGDLLVGVNTLAPPPTLELSGTATKAAVGEWGTGDEGVQGEFTVERYDASGTRVGESRVDIDPANDDSYLQARIAAILPQADGTTLLLGSASVGAGDERRTQFVRVLLGADGRPVAGFGEDGVAIDADPGLDAVAVVGGHQAGGPEGSVVIGGEDGENLVLRRYLADGSVDASYGGTFPHEQLQGTSTTTAAFAPDGSLYFSIIFGGQLLHFTASGRPDTGYSATGADADDLSRVAFERIAVQADGKLLLAGRDADTGQSVVTRLNADGTLDTTYGDGGTRRLPLPDGLTSMMPRALTVQPDGKALVGGDGRDDSERGDTQPEEPAPAVAVEPGGSVGFVARLGGDPEPPVTTTGTTTTTDTTTTTTTTTETQTTPPPAAKPVAAASTNPLPVAKSCVSRRSFKIRLRIPHGDVATSATVKVNGKQVKVVKGSRLRAAIDLRGLPKGKATISIVVKLAHGKKPLTGSRVYRTCMPKRGSSVPAL